MTDDPFLSKPAERAQPAQPTAQPAPYVPPGAPPAQEIPAPPEHVPGPPEHVPGPPAPVYTQPGYTQPGYTQPGGYPPPPPAGYGVTKPKTWMNWVAFGCGLGGLFTCGLSSIVAIVFGHLGMSAAKRGEADQRGIGLAGLILGYAAIGLGIAWLVLMIILAAADSTY